MPVSKEVYEILRSQSVLEDPWRLESNPFEQLRYVEMLRAMGPDRTFESVLEVGCAVGAFSERLAGRAHLLRVVDVVPEAIARCRARLTRFSNVRYSVEDIESTEGWAESYDLVVVAEVLCFLLDRAALETTTRKLAGWVRPGGRLIYCSARDAAVRRWSLGYGAESTLAEWTKWLDEVGRAHCVGRTADEDALVVHFARRR